MVGPAAKRAAVAHLQAELGLSERRACSIAGADRRMVRYRSRRPPDGELLVRLRELASERRRFGYRRLFVLLRREGERSGINRIYRLYREEGLAVRKRRSRRKACGVRRADFTALRLVGAAYLIYLGVNLRRAPVAQDAAMADDLSLVLDREPVHRFQVRHERTLLNRC